MCTIRLDPECIEVIHDGCYALDTVRAENVSILCTPRPPPQFPVPDAAIPSSWKGIPDGTVIDGREWHVWHKLRSWLRHPSIDVSDDEFPVSAWLPFVRGYGYASDEEVFQNIWSSIQWKRKMRVNEATLDLYKFSPRLLEYEKMCPAGVIGHDPLNHPVFYEHISNVDSRTFMTAVTDEEFTNIMIARREVQRLYFAECSNKMRKRIYKMIMVIDVAGMDRGHLGSAFLHRFKSFNSSFSSNFPDSMLKIVIINAPLIFQVLWNVIKVFINPVTAKKIVIAGARHDATFAQVTLLPGAQMHGRTLKCNPRPWSRIWEEYRDNGKLHDLRRV